MRENFQKNMFSVLFALYPRTRVFAQISDFLKAFQGVFGFILVNSRACCIPKNSREERRSPESYGGGCEFVGVLDTWEKMFKRSGSPYKAVCGPRRRSAALSPDAACACVIDNVDGCSLVMCLTLVASAQRGGYWHAGST